MQRMNVIFLLLMIPLHTVKRTILLFIACVACLQVTVHAQNEKRWLKRQITTLSGGSMHGRGYVFKGGEKAAAYIRRRLMEFGVQPFNKDTTYYQPYFMSINTFPNDVLLKINKEVLVPGQDFLAHAASSSYITDGSIRLKRIDLKNVKDSAGWAKVKQTFTPDKGYYLKNADTVTKYLKFSIRSFAKEFPKGLFIVPKHGKMIWTACTEAVPGTIITLEDTVAPKRPRKAAVRIEAKFNPSFKNQNVLGYVPGTTYPDSFIVFSAHYDHLGQMGSRTVFPGAHDNASGTAMVLYLAKYFAEHPQPYSVAFMLFSGEEAGLLGSRHYVKNPVFPLSNIRFLVNLDMTGDASNGITMVNGEANPIEHALMDKINGQKAYIPKINKREQTQNSDHWPFCEQGVKGVFIYANGDGSNPYYHDVFDKANALSLQNVDGLAKLLIDFTTELAKGK